MDENGEVIEIHDFKNAIELTPLKATKKDLNQEY